MRAIAGFAGLAVLAIVLWDGFATMAWPRYVSSRIRIAPTFYRASWLGWSLLARRRRALWHQRLFGLYGPASLLLLLLLWALTLVLGFAMLYWALGPALDDPQGRADFGTALYMSGTTLFTLGLGDVTPEAPLTRALTVLETGVGFAFLALIIRVCSK